VMGLTILPKVPSTTKQLLTTGPANSWVPRSLPGLVLDLGTMMRDGRGSWLYRALQWIGCLSSDAQLFICGPRRQRHACIYGEKSHSLPYRCFAANHHQSKCCKLLSVNTSRSILFLFLFLFQPQKRSRGR
jgi:hypothetical protein